MNRVLIEQVKDYDTSEIRRVVNNFFKKAGLADKLSGRRVLLKPNLLGIFPEERAVTTNPAVVSAVASVLSDYGCSIGIGDSAGIITTNSEKLYSKTGMTLVANKYNAVLEDFSQPKKYFMGKGTYVKYYNLANVLDRYDYIINMPKLKTHMFQILTCSVKNLFGFIPGRAKAGFHLKLSNSLDFADMLIDVALFVKPIYTIVDAVTAMQGEGPSAGEPIKLGVLFGGDDVFFLDAVISYITGLNKHLPLLIRIEQRGLVQLPEVIKRANEIGVYPLKAPVKNTIDRRLPLWLRQFLKEITTNKPVVDKDLCIGCGVCAENCPPGTITIANHRAVINYSACIRCFCCHELCPEGAMKVKKSLLH